MRYSYFFTFCALCILWSVFSQKFSAFFLVSGSVAIFSAVLVKFLFKNVINNHETRFNFTNFVKLKPYFVFYFFWLLYQAILSSLSVFNIVIFSDRDKLGDSTKIFSVDDMSNFQIMLLANSITFTPGTITLECSDKRIRVHALTKDLLEDFENGFEDLKCRIVKSVY